jgi:glutamate racemase
VVVMGVKSLIESPAFEKFVASEQDGKDSRNGEVHGVNASAMVELVESAAFLSNPLETQVQVDGFISNIKRQRPAADVYTLSSTHLPWLRSFFERAAPDVEFVDPAQAVVESFEKLATEGSGGLETWVTQNPLYPVEEFAELLRRLQLDISFSVCQM